MRSFPFTLRNVVKKYGDVTAVDRVSLDIRAGEFLVLLGPSGCGKTSIIRMIAGLEEITAGTIAMEDQVINEWPPGRRNIALVFQDLALYPHMTARQNMRYALEIARLDKREIETRVRDAAALLQIEHLIDRKPSQLSGGERQRVALGREIVRRPNILLLDEPMTALDAKLRVQMRSELQKLHNKLGTTMVMVTHDQVEAMTMATRIAVMKQGQVLQVGEPETIYREPVNMYVAGFLGSPSMNFIPSTLRRDSNEIVGSKNALRLTDSKVRNIAQTRLVVGVRPHNVTITGPTDPRTQLRGEVSAVEPLGDRVIVLVDTPEGELTIMESVSASQFSIGEQVGLVCDLANTYVFDAESENRIDVRLGANGALVADGQREEHLK